MQRFIVSGILLCLLSSNAQTQQPDPSGYRMQPVAIQTRWAGKVNPKNVLPEYPRPQMVRGNWTNLNGLWEYAITKGDKQPEKFNGNILVPFPVESALSGVKKSLAPEFTYNKLPVPENVLWYKRKFNAPALKPGEHLLLNFGAVSWEATVYVNNQQIGHHNGSYTAFSVDITKAIQNGENQLVVKVTNPLENGIGPRGKQTLFPAGIFYTPSSGIWQTVWLEKAPANYIKGIIITPDVDKSQVRVKVETASDAKVSIKAGGKTVQGQANTEILIPINKPKLWSPDEPYLYDADISVGADVVKTYFGMRKIEIKKDEKGIDRIYLNNKYTYNLGTLDQGFWPDGLYTAPTDEALKFDIEASKAMGFNTIRKHIKVEPARWYYYADKLGMIVWQDLVQPSVQFGAAPTPAAKEQFEKESAEMLQQLHHFPSITTWGLFNESWGEYDQARLTKWVKDTDPSRLVNGHSGAAIVGGFVDRGVVERIESRSVNSDMTDVHSYPPPAIPPHVNGKAMVLGEFGGIGVQIQDHLWDDVAGWGYGATVSPESMIKQYASMTETLIELEKRGLSASIYTQPFDVEGEQNGLITYDREIIKMPVEQIRAIHAKLWPATANYMTVTKDFTAKVAEAKTKDYATRLQEYKAGKKDSAFLRTLALMAKGKNDLRMASEVGTDYIRSIKNPITETNIRFIQAVTYSSTDTGFDIILNNLDKIKTVTGSRESSYTVQDIIFKEQVDELLTEDPNWAAVDAIIKKYPQIDGEFVIGNGVVKYLRAIWQRQRNALRNLVKAATIYDDRYNGGAYNEWAWAIFSNSTDTTELLKGLEWSRKSLVETPNDAVCARTYANLLYKLGRKEEAIQWQQKAISLNANEESYKGTLELMKEGKPTWVVQ